jgi:hypothetical protein
MVRSGRHRNRINLWGRKVRLVIRWYLSNCKSLQTIQQTRYPILGKPWGHCRSPRCVSFSYPTFTPLGVSPCGRYWTDLDFAAHFAFTGQVLPPVYFISLQWFTVWKHRCQYDLVLVTYRTLPHARQSIQILDFWPQIVRMSRVRVEYVASWASTSYPRDCERAR